MACAPRTAWLRRRSHAPHCNGCVVRRTGRARLAPADPPDYIVLCICATTDFVTNKQTCHELIYLQHKYKSVAYNIQYNTQSQSREGGMEKKLSAKRGDTQINTMAPREYNNTTIPKQGDTQINTMAPREYNNKCMMKFESNHNNEQQRLDHEFSSTQFCIILRHHKLQ